MNFRVRVVLAAGLAFAQAAIAMAAQPPMWCEEYVCSKAWPTRQEAIQALHDEFMATVLKSSGETVIDGGVVHVDAYNGPVTARGLGVYVLKTGTSDARHVQAYSIQPVCPAGTSPKSADAYEETACVGADSGAGQ